MMRCMSLMVLVGTVALFSACDGSSGDDESEEQGGALDLLEWAEDECTWEC